MENIYTKEFILDKVNKRGFYSDWIIYKDDWRLIQSLITKYNHKGHVCPVCGKILLNHFPAHMSYHGFNGSDYVLFLNNLTELPKCAYLNCNNKVGMYNYYTLNSYCSYSCEYYERSRLGTNPFQHNNLKFDENGQSIKHKMIVKGQLEKGIHPWSSNNLKRNEEGKSITHIQGYITKQNNGTTYSWNKCIRTNFILNNKLCRTRSLYEFITLAWLLLIKKLNSSDIIYEKEQDNSFKRIDFYSKSEDLYYEPHYSTTLEEKKKLYDEEFPEYKIIYYGDSDIDKMIYELIKLNDSRFNLKYYFDCDLLRSNKFCYNFDEFKVIN